VAALEGLGGKIVEIMDDRPAGSRFRWRHVFAALAQEGLHSVMVEGGASVINALLGPEGDGCVDSIVVTVAPVWLGDGSLFVRPERVRGSGVDEEMDGHGDGDGEDAAAATLADVVWMPLGRDVVMCGKPVKRTVALPGVEDVDLDHGQ
jgi:2,5-diamino-6-(ribosylamino)-4(3H)-pyrimidinone 5'-phosphate reductase